MLADKAIAATLAELAGGVSRWFAAPLPVPRGSDAGPLVAALAGLGAEVEGCASVAEACARARAAAADGDRIVVFGSFHTVAAALEADGAG
jgi:dihydrofolate synthase/folylpolyglutamate synthase